MQGFDEFCDDDDDDAGVAPHPLADVPLVIGVGAGASVASAGAALLGLQFRQTRCTFKELMEGEVIAHKQDRGEKGSKTYIAIRKSATTPLSNKLLGPHIAPECPLPRDEEKCKKAHEACLKAQAGHGGQGGGRGGRGG